MKTSRILCLLVLGLFCGFGAAQEPAPIQTGFQGLWKERSGHSLHLDYGFFLGKWDAKYAATRLPLRFDLYYQYDIPWKFKRTNFFAETGLGYMWGDFEYTVDSRETWTYHRALLHLGAGLKVYCSDWLYLSFGVGLDVGYGHNEGNIYGNSGLWRSSREDLSGLGGYSAASIVGQIKQFSVFLGYRADHWINWNFGFTPLARPFAHTDWFITLGVGYHF